MLTGIDRVGGSFSVGLQATGAQARLDAAIGRIDGIESALTSIESAIATIQQAIAIMQQELGALRAPDPSQYQKTETRKEGTPPNERTVSVQVLDTAAFNAAMSTYLNKVADLQQRIASKQGELAQKEQELAGKQSELAAAQRELTDAQQALEAALQNDQKALAEARKRAEEAQQRAKDLAEQALKSQAEAQKAQDELQKAQQELQRSAEAAARLAGVAPADTATLLKKARDWTPDSGKPPPFAVKQPVDDAAVRAATRDMAAATKAAAADVQNASNYLPRMVDGELRASALRLSARDYLELVPHLASYEAGGVFAADAGLLSGAGAPVPAGQLTPALASQMYSAWKTAGFSDADINQAMLNLAGPDGVAMLGQVDQGKVDEATKRIHELLDQSGFLADVTHDELVEINDVLRALNPAETSAVFDAISEADMETWGKEINSGGWFGTGGLSGDEKRGLMDMLAERLDGEQLVRFSDALGNRDDTVALARAVAEHADDTTKVDYIGALADRTNTGDDSRLSTSFGVSTVTDEDPEALAVGLVLASLKNDSTSFTAAIAQLDDGVGDASDPAQGQLASVLKTAASASLTSTASSSSVSTTVGFDPDLLVGIIDAAATCNDPGVKARIFAGAAEQLEEIQDSGNLLVPNINQRQDAGQVMDAMTRLLTSDTCGVMGELETQYDRDGASVSAYAEEMVAQDKAAELGEIIVALQRGNDRQGDPMARFGVTAPGTNGGSRYPNAESLGYFVGAIQVGIAAHTTDRTDQANVLKNIFGTVAGAVGAHDPVSGAVASIANGLTSAIVDEWCRKVESGGEDLRSAIRALAYPRGAGGQLYTGPAENSYDATVGRVIDAQGDN